MRPRLSLHSPALKAPPRRKGLGNSTYRNPLGNPKNDAADTAAALRKLNFKVIDGTNLDKGPSTARWPSSPAR